LYRHNESGRYYVRAFRQGKELAFADVGNQEWFISDLAAASSARTNPGYGSQAVPSILTLLQV
jgi:hypothetical protein